METALLIKESALVITPDTSIVHIASAFSIPTIAIYREDKKGEHNLITWGPNSDKATIIIGSKGEKSKDIGEEVDINNFELSELSENIYKILKI